MTTKYMLFVLFLVLTLLPGPNNIEFTHSVAMRGCTQEDAPALEIYLTCSPYTGTDLPDQPFIHIEVGGRDWQRLIGKDLELLPLSRTGISREKPLVRAELKLKQEQQSFWLNGALRLTKVEPDTQVIGSYDFAGPDQQKWKGDFRANWIKRPGGCG